MAWYYFQLQEVKERDRQGHEYEYVCALCVYAHACTHMSVVCERKKPAIYIVGKKGRGCHVQSSDFHFTKIRTIHFTDKETEGLGEAACLEPC